MVWEEQSYTFWKHIFEGIKEYDEYLSLKFGNYIGMQPESERKVYPVSKIKLIEAEIDI